MESDYESFDDIADEDLIALGDSFSSRPSIAATNSPPRGGGALTNSRPAKHPIQDINLEDWPSDDLLTSPEREQPAQPSRNQPRTFHQTTLLGRTLVGEEPRPAASQSRPRVYRGDQPAEAPTHHVLDNEALKTWVYPMNLGPIRDYQFSIVKNGLFNNTLVALPTGLGKTFIAATIILNFFRWTRNAQMVFVAPTKPLASQQVEACLNIAGIPRSQATLLTGETKPVLRESEWAEKRLFFMTPQTLMNDLSKGYADPKRLVLLVVDEAHRATGEYAYVKVIEFLRRFTKSFRVLALTATPGSSVEGVQDVIDNLGVSHVEIRTEESIDIRSYVHSREIDRVILEPSDEIIRLKELFSKALKPLVSKVNQQNIYTGRDPMSITAFGLMKQRKDWFEGPGRHANQGVKMMLMAIFTILQGLAHSIKLLDFHGIRPFYDYLATFRSEAEGKGAKGSKYKRQLIEDESFTEMMDLASKWLKLPNFVGHPKMTHVSETLLNHFMDAGPGSSTRVIVFAEFRDSAEEITRTLNVHKPLISATLFVGQADSKKSEGMKQKQQIETIEKFRSGTYNVLVATSIGEEGLDIGQVDLIICYDASASPIRMLQRMGRTGRKRAGKITLLLMKGKEEENFLKAQDNYEKMQRMICEGSRFNFRHDLSSRIVPRDIKPEVDKRAVEIPIENTQDTSLPEPKARNTRGMKASKKKFHMPDGVDTGFTSVAAMLNMGSGKTAAKKPKAAAKKPEPQESDDLASIPPLEKVVLDSTQLAKLNRQYRDLPVFRGETEDVSMPSLSAHPELQRKLRPTSGVKHGGYTKRCVAMLKRLSESQDIEDRHTRPYGHVDTSRYREIPVPPYGDESSAVMISSSLSASSSVAVQTYRKRSTKTAPSKVKHTSVVDEYSSGSDDEEAETSVVERSPKRQKTTGVTSCRRASAVDEYPTDSDEDGGRGDSEDNGSVGSLADFISEGEANGELVDGGDSSEEDDLVGVSKSRSYAPKSSRRRQPGSSATSPPSRSEDSNRPFYVPVELPGTQQTEEDDMPSLDALLGRKKKGSGGNSGRGRGRVSDVDEEDEGGNVRKRPVKRRAKRPVMEDSETE